MALDPEVVAREAELREWRIKGEEIKRTLDSPGFAIIMQFVADRAKMNLAQMASAQTEFDMIKHHAAYLAFNSLEEFCKSTCRTILSTSVAGK
jgi:hypothetical protein